MMIWWSYERLIWRLNWRLYHRMTRWLHRRLIRRLHRWSDRIVVTMTVIWIVEACKNTAKSSRSVVLPLWSRLGFEKNSKTMLFVRAFLWTCCIALYPPIDPSNASNAPLQREFSSRFVWCSMLDFSSWRHEKEKKKTKSSFLAWERWVQTLKKWVQTLKIMMIMMWWWWTMTTTDT